MDDPRHFNAHPLLDPGGAFLNGFSPLHEYPYANPGYHYPPNIYHEESSFSPDYHHPIPGPRPTYRGVHYHAPKDPFLHDGGYPHYPGHGWYFNQGPRYQQPQYGYYEADSHHSRRDYYDESSSGRRPGKKGPNSVRLAYVPRREDHENGYQNRNPPDSGRQYQSPDHSRQPLQEEADPPNHLSQNFPSLRSSVISTASEEPPPIQHVTHQVQQPPQLAPTQQPAQPLQVAQAQQTQASQQPPHLQPKPPPQQPNNNSKNNYTVLTPGQNSGAPPVAQAPTPSSQLRILKPETSNPPSYQHQEANYNNRPHQSPRPSTPTQKSKSGKNSKSQSRSNWVVLSSPSSSRHHANNTQSSKCSTPKPINLPRAETEPEKPARAWEIKKDPAQVSAWEIKRDPQEPKKDNLVEQQINKIVVKKEEPQPNNPVSHHPHQTNYQNHTNQPINHHGQNLPHQANHQNHINQQQNTNHQHTNSHQHQNPPISSHFFRRGRDDYLSSTSSSPSPSPSPSSSGGMSGTTYSASSSRSISPSPPPSPVPSKPRAWEIRQPEPVLDYDMIFNENITNKKTGRPQQELIEHLHISVGLTGKSFVARITGYDQYGMLVDILIDTEYHKYELHQRILWTEFPTEVQNWTLQQKLQLSRERMPIKSEFKVHVSDIHAMKVLRLQPSKYPYPVLKSLSVPLAPARCPFRYLVVIDFEATCDYAPNPLVNTRTAEIIEFPWVVIDTTTFKIIDKHQIYVKPDFIEGVTPYATKLTGITPQMLVNQATLATVLKKFDDYVTKHFGEKRNFSLLTDGIWDLQVQLRTEAKRKQVDLKWYYHQYIDIKEEFRKFWPWFPSTFQPGLNIMLNAIGMEFEGKPHCGIEDAQNIARVVLQLLTLGHSFGTQKTIPASYDPFQDQQFVDFGSVADANAWQCPNTSCGLWNRPWKKECKFCFRSKTQSNTVFPRV